MTNYNEITATLFELERYLDNVNQRIEKTEQEKNKNKEELDKIKEKIKDLHNYEKGYTIHHLIYPTMMLLIPIITMMVNKDVEQVALIRTFISMPISFGLGIGYAFIIDKIQMYKEKKLVEEGEGQEFVKKIEECEKVLKKYCELKEMLVKARESLKEEIINEKVVNEEVVNFDMYEDPTFEDDKIREFSPVKTLKK